MVYEQDKLYILLNIQDEEERVQRLKELDQEQTDNRVTELKKQLENKKSLDRGNFLHCVVELALTHDIRKFKKVNTKKKYFRSTKV